MTSKEIAEKLHTWVDLFTKTNAYMGQSPYRDDIFGLFVQAFRNEYFDPQSRPRLTGAGIRDYIIENYANEENEYNDLKIKRTESLGKMWDEWYYAVNNYPFDRE